METLHQSSWYILRPSKSIIKELSQQLFEFRNWYACYYARFVDLPYACAVCFQMLPCTWYNSMACDTTLYINQHVHGQTL